MKTKVWTLTSLLVALGVLAALGGFAVAASGVIPIKASSGHFPITAWFLNFAKERSIATHTLGMELPPLDEPRLVLQGAGHYETACRPCHGSPELKHPKIPAAMTPHPPYLPVLIPERTPEELFYVVKHGIKFTGMPAWPAQHRNDEILAVVAFLLELPSLDAAAYRKLVYGELPTRGVVESMQDLAEREPTPRAVALSCARCHGVDGLGRELPAFPKLAGQKREYLERAMEAYALGHRASGMMEPIAAGLSVDERRLLADYYSSRPAIPSRSTRDAAAIERGRSIAARGVENQNVPSCMDCHGPGTQRRNESYPRLAGQHSEYLVQQLELFHRGHRGGSYSSHLMAHVAPHLDKAQMHDVAAYYASLSEDGTR